jgi:hypothetical protein
MERGKVWREFIALPPEGQRQVADFVASLRERYRTTRPEGTPHAKDIADEPFIGMWQDRLDMGDSSAWVRNVRDREWVKRRG